MEHKPKILIAIRESLYRDLFAAEEDRRLRQLGRLDFAVSDENLTSRQLADAVGDVDIVITGWGAPVFTGRGPGRSRYAQVDRALGRLHQALAAAAGLQTRDSCHACRRCFGAAGRGDYPAARLARAEAIPQD